MSRRKLFPEPGDPASQVGTDDEDENVANTPANVKRKQLSYSDEFREAALECMLQDSPPDIDGIRTPGRHVTAYLKGKGCPSSTQRRWFSDHLNNVAQPGRGRKEYFDDQDREAFECCLTMLQREQILYDNATLREMVCLAYYAAAIQLFITFP